MIVIHLYIYQSKYVIIYKLLQKLNKYMYINIIIHCPQIFRELRMPKTSLSLSLMCECFCLSMCMCGIPHFTKSTCHQYCFRQSVCLFVMWFVFILGIYIYTHPLQRTCLQNRGKRQWTQLYIFVVFPG